MVHQQNYTQSTYGYEQNATKSEVEDLFHGLERAIRDGDLDGIMSFYSDEIVAYDMVPPLEYTDKNKLREVWKRCFTDYFKFPIQFNFERQTISVSGELAFANSLVHLVGRSKSGEPMNNWYRNTICMKKFNGTWLITNDHQSVPLDEKTMTGMLNLKPQVH